VKTRNYNKKKMMLLKNSNQSFVKLKVVQASPKANTISPHLILPKAPKIAQTWQ
jgi:hypothetical protein